MTTADHLAIVNRTLRDGDRALVLAHSGLVQDWVKSARLLAVVAPSKGDDCRALFVFSTTLPLRDDSDLTLDSALAIDADFGYEIECGNPVIFKVSSGDARLLFEMVPGQQTQRFVGEVADLAGNASKRKTGSNVGWLQTYKGKETELTDRMENVAVSNSNPDVGTPIAARESVVKYQMSMKEDQFTEIRKFTVCAATWNVNGQSPPPDGFVPEWLTAASRHPPDLYAIGFQELDLTKEAFIFNESTKEEEWRKCVAGSLHPAAKYQQVRLVRLVGMMLVIYVKEEHAGALDGVESDTVGTGIMGKLGNKGGVAVRMDFHNTSVCFVNAHLAAHVTEYERRNQDYHDILSRIAFGNLNPSKSIKDHDVIFWIGDLNYRINDLDPAEVKEMIAEGKLQELLDNDQLRQQKLQRKIFDGYEEGVITFIPTYRYDAGTDEWDTSEKGRAPAWTDRILWRGGRIEQTGYRSHQRLKVSDHKPVSAVFGVGVKVVDAARYRKVYEEVMKKLDKLENEFLPQVTVDTTEVRFDDVRFMEPIGSTLTCANTGQVPVQFDFIKKPNDKAICKPWLSVEPGSGFVMPGDTAVIKLEIYVGKKTAGNLTCGQDQLYDILVLHLVGGKDIFITVSGSYRQSCFGSSIDDLCKLTVPIAELAKGRSQAAVDAEPYPVPKELWFLCDLIAKMGLQNEQVFLQPGLRSEILSIRDWLDTGLPVDGPANASIHSVAESLLLLLESFRLPVIPYSMYNRCLDCAPNYLQCKQIVSQLPTHHRHVFKYICSFLKEVIRHSNQNGIDPKILAALFASMVLRDPPGTNLGTGIRARTNQQLLEHKKVRFFYHFLVNDDPPDG